MDSCCSTRGHPPPAPSPSQSRGGNRSRRGNGQLSYPTHPPSPTWAEVAREGSSGGETRAKPPVFNSTPARTIYSNTPAGSGASHLPSAHSQFLAWECCRRRGIPARLVLDTDGATEEVSFWFRSGANVGGPTNVATHVAPTHVASGKRRRERARRRRRREERRREAEGNLPPPGTPKAGVGTGAACTPPAPPRESSPTPSESTRVPASALPTMRARCHKARPLVLKKAKAALAASRASQRAATLAKRRGAAVSRQSASSESTPEKLRGAGEDNNLNITDAAGGASVAPSLDQTPEVTEELCARRKCARCSECEPDFEEEYWRDGRRFNTRSPPWDLVFPEFGKCCRFCRADYALADGDGSCSSCHKLTTLQLIMKHAAIYKYRKEY
jgi:hypothetical protein